MNSPGSIAHKGDLAFPTAVLRHYDDYGQMAVDLCAPPSRLWVGAKNPPDSISQAVDEARVSYPLSPAGTLVSPPQNLNWSALSSASLARLWPYFLIAEDPERRLDARLVSTLAHQVSLIRHILGAGQELSRVLIADEVGLGKTVEAGLLIQSWLELQPRLRVLYLAPARLVANVAWEFDRLGLPFRRWATGADSDARLSDSLIVASIHKAVHSKNIDALAQAGPWDVVIVDECHHLSAWSPGGGSSTQKFALVQKLIQQQKPDGRVVLLSGTPHQGTPTRFANLLSLLLRDGEDQAKLAGRVIYRTKDDVSDWEGRPLFPGRNVAPPIVVDLGKDYRVWIEEIRQFFTPAPGSALSQAKGRGVHWRRSQALQWAASSPQAGLGFLIRQAIRAGWNPNNNPLLASALESIRPYRLGPANEDINLLFTRIQKEILRQTQDADIEDIEEFDDRNGSLDRTDKKALESLLNNGIALLRSHSNRKWESLNTQVLKLAGDEKIVLFAQPIETVTALACYLEKTTGERPAMILGGQSDPERQQEIDRFRRIDGPRYLVSSRAGGEGINLQCARRLVHIDIPWNPMEMEQRVGRVHRFGSQQTIQVDTLVVKDSREASAYTVARRKLQHITQALVPHDKFESLFSRVMCLIPPDEFANFIGETVNPSLSDSDQAALAELVQQGYQSWNAFHTQYSVAQRAIRATNPGMATWGDLETFLIEHAKVQEAAGFQTLRFDGAAQDGKPIAKEVPVRVLQWQNGNCFLAENHDGMPVRGPEGISAAPLGLNISPVAEILRNLATSKTVTGAAHLGWKGGKPPVPAGSTVGVLVLLRQTFRIDTQPILEQRITLHVYYVDPSGNTGEWMGNERQEVYRGLLRATVRQKPKNDPTFNQLLLESESIRIQELRTVSNQDRTQGLRHTVWPLLAAVVTV